MELRLVIQDAEHRQRDIGVEIQPSATVGRLIDAIAEHTAGPDARRSSWSARLRRTQQWLDRDAVLATVDIRNGDGLHLERTSGQHATVHERQSSSAIRDLTVVGGPDLGRRFRIATGRHRIGRDPKGEIVLDDPSASASHASLLVTPQQTVITDLGSRNGTSIEGVALRPSEPTPVADGAIVRIGRTLLRLDPLDGAARAVVATDGIIPFNRPPRRSRPPEPQLLQAPAPPEDPPKLRLPLAASLIPLVFAGVLAVVLPQMGAMMLVFAALTPILAVASYVEDRRSGRMDFKGNVETWRRELEGVKTRAAEARVREIEERRSSAPDTAVLLDRAGLREPGLWERRPEDRDFLVLRAGVVDQPSMVTIDLADGGSPSLRTEAEGLTASKTAPSVPLLVPLAGLGVIGLSGDSERVTGLARSLILQAAVLHSPRHLLIAAAIGNDRTRDWDWLKWLPHAHPEASPLGGAHVAAGAGADKLIGRLMALVASRREEAHSASFGAEKAQPLPIVLVLLDESIPVSRPTLARLLRDGPSQGVVAVWLGSDAQELPGECRAIGEFDPTVAALTWTDTTAHEIRRDVIPDGVPRDVAEELARTLAPMRDASADRGAAEIPSSVGLLDLLGTAAPNAAWIASRWRASGADVIAPIGATVTGPWSVDLLRDGPHGLIAGTTGAGKSELLQTLVASLAATLPPTRLTFLLIDYKGGAAFKECVAFPHTVGFVTDLDAHLTNRALVSLNAELKHREHVLGAAGAKDLAAMVRKDPEGAPPRLLIVVDEFATLAKEVPDFVEGLVDVAQRGRSLGVHMLLATQRPAGVVTANIRANTNLRIALRVSDATDSDDVIGVPDAARIPRDLPGRAYARTGHSDLVEFQAGYAGRRVITSTSGPAIRVFDLDLAGDPALSAGGGPQRTIAAPDVFTELQLVVAGVEGATRQAGMAAPRRPWLPSLPPLVSLDSIPDPETSTAANPIAILGLLDEPSTQDQRPLTFDLDQEGSLLIFGSGGSGKTTVLRTLAASLARQGDPTTLRIYGMDFGSRGLAALEALPACGSVITGGDEERVQRLFRMLRKEIARRKELFGQNGVSDLRGHNGLPGVEPLPRILVLLDGYEGFVATYERVAFGELIDLLPRLVSDGRATGIHMVISAERRGSTPTALFASIPARIVLRLADEDEYSSFGLPGRTLKDAKLPPGRGFTQGSLEVQVAVVGDDGAPTSQAAGMVRLGEVLAARSPGDHAPRIGILPVLVTLNSLPVASPGRGTIGIGDEDLAPVEVDLGDGHVFVAGPVRSGRSTALASVAQAIHASTPEATFHLLAPRKSALTGLTLWASSTKGRDACDDRITALAAELERMPDQGPPVVIVIDDGEELAETSASSTLEEIVASGRERNIRFLVAVESRAAQRAYAGWLTQIRASEQGVLLDPDPDVDGDLLGARLPRGSGKPMPPGRGYLIRAGAPELVQVAATGA